MSVPPLFAAVALSALAGSLQVQNPQLQRLIERGRHPAIRWGDFSDVRAEAKALYGQNGWQPLWVARGRPTRAARALLDALTTAGDRGLDPEDYDARQLAALAATLERRGADAEQEVRFDAALTIGALRIVAALARGRLAPGAAKLGFRPTTRLDPVATVLQLRGTLTPGPILTALEPTWSHYLALKRALARYRALVRDSTSWKLPRPRINGVREGHPYTGAPRLRRLLAALGDLTPQAGVPRADDSLFTGELADGIRRFQARGGAHVDGLLDEASWRLLSRQFPGRIRQMELALERWRWLPRELEGSVPLFVSLPAMRLHYSIPSGGAEFLPVSMRVSLGSGFERERPVHADMLRLLLLRPPDRGFGTVLFPFAGDPRLYLHGSSPADSFEEAAGCIRAADAELLTVLLLRDRSEWPLERIHSAMAGPKPVYVRLRRSVPVLVVYGTAVARENGQVFFYQDSFGQDRRLEQQLAEGYPYVR